MANVTLIAPFNMAAIPTAVPGTGIGGLSIASFGVLGLDADGDDNLDHSLWYYGEDLNGPPALVNVLLYSATESSLTVIGNPAYEHVLMIDGLFLPVAAVNAVITDRNLFALFVTALSGNDRVTGTYGADGLLGHGGADLLFGGGGPDVLEGGPGGDRLNGGPGLDEASYSLAGSRVVADLLNPGLNRGVAAGDLYIAVERLSGTAFDDTLRGNNAANQVTGGPGGKDLLVGRGGADILRGFGNNDVLVGGPGRDTMEGGIGADRFDFNAVAEIGKGANRDVITDFFDLDGDMIDLATIDASTVQPGNQAFVYIGSQSFAAYHAAHPNVWGMLRFAGGVLQGNVDGQLTADFEIGLPGVFSLAGGSIIR